MIGPVLQSSTARAQPASDPLKCQLRWGHLVTPQILALNKIEHDRKVGHLETMGKTLYTILQIHANTFSSIWRGDNSSNCGIDGTLKQLELKEVLPQNQGIRRIYLQINFVTLNSTVYTPLKTKWNHDFKMINMQPKK